MNKLKQEEVDRLLLVSKSITEPDLRLEITYFINAILGEVGADEVGKVLSPQTRQERTRALEEVLDAQKERILAMQDLLAA